MPDDVLSLATWHCVLHYFTLNQYWTESVEENIWTWKRSKM